MGGIEGYKVKRFVWFWITYLGIVSFDWTFGNRWKRVWLRLVFVCFVGAGGEEGPDAGEFVLALAGTTVRQTIIINSNSN
jgi:hypothetical protein